MAKNELSVSILSSEGVVMNEVVYAVSSVNQDGPFDILPFHSNFISIIQHRIVIQHLGGKKTEMAIDKAVLRAYENTIQIFLGIDLVQ